MQILVAAEHGDVERVQEILAADPAQVNTKGEYDKTPLHWAAEKNFRRLAEVLVAGGADIDAETTWGSTPLQWAANMGSRDVADLLLENGAAPQLNMWAAAGLGMLDVVQSFWKSSSSSRLKPNAGQTRSRKLSDGSWGRTAPPETYEALVSEAFYIAARNGHIHVAKFLLDKGADINRRGFFGAPGLHWAAINGHKEMVEFLIAHGADIHLRDEKFDSTPLGWAREGHQLEIAELLKGRGLDR
jgi:ankyrin repeat protein